MSEILTETLYRECIRSEKKLRDLGIRLVHEAEIPAGAHEITTNIHVDEEALLRSLWGTLGTTSDSFGVLHGVRGEYISFYRTARWR
jgi:hypothetical protein